MIVIDQLRITDDGLTMYLDAHVNKASYFDDVYIDKVTILTEDQVSELSPTTYSDTYIYQKQVSTLKQYSQAQERVTVLSENQLLSKMMDDGGWKITLEENKALTACSFLLSGKFSAMGDGTATPKLLVTTADYTPDGDGLTGGNILLKIDGELYDKDYDSGHPIWKFKGSGDFEDVNTLCFYLYKTESDGTHTLIRLDETDDVEFLHFYYMPYTYSEAENAREIHLVLCAQDFNENFTKKDLTSNMFFVYITAGGTPSSDTPCRLDEMTTLGVTFDYGLIYNNALCYTRELNQNCEMPDGFTDFLLHVAALKLSIETEHYIPAIQQYKYLYNNGCAGVASTSGAKSCGCGK